MFLLVSGFVISVGSETEFTGKCGDWLRQPGIPDDVHERRICNGDPEHLFLWYLPVCVDDEGPEALETIDMYLEY